MRGRWMLASAAVIAIVAVSAFGGLTRAYAGVTHWMGKTTIATRFCVYIDRTSPPASYGDVTVEPKYGHKTCIVGKPGAPGTSSVITWNKTVATPAVPTAKRFGSVSHYVDLAKVGPFTVRGYCYGGEGVGAATDVLSAQDGSSFAWADSMYAGSFNSGANVQASNSAVGGPGSPGLATEYRRGEFTATTGDQKTAFTGWATNGVYIQGAEGPACSFIGHLVIENAPAS